MGLRTIAAGGVLALAAATLPIGSVSAGDGNEERFVYTGAEQTWQVPADVCSVDVLAQGASGGEGVTPRDSGTPAERGPVFLAPGGLGGSVLGTIEVTAGETLYLNVGGQGEAAWYTAVGARPIPVGGAGGFNGGGDGGYGGEATGAGGGGASDIRQGGNTLADRVLVAGGGGGSAGFSWLLNIDIGNEVGRVPTSSGLGGHGGGAGTPDGAAGLDAEGGAGGGGGGTQTAAGTGGAGHPDGSDGGSGDGGSAGESTKATFAAGGGGGGGYYGGGAGGGGEWPSDGDSLRDHADWEGAGGGGGSSYGPANSDYGLAVQEDDGSIILTYLEDPGCDTEPTTTTTTTTAPTTTTTAAAKAQALAPTFTG